VLAKFPRTLLISATRDYGLSNVVHTHTALVKAAVPANLHVWEGLGHCFFFDSDLPESREAYDVIVGFFRKALELSGAQGCFVNVVTPIASGRRIAEFELHWR